MGYDPRIGRGFLDAGLGYGGSCFPKDVKALAYMATVQGKHPQLLQAVMEINKYQRRQMVLKTRELLGGSLKGKTVGLLGLAFKPNTDDMREAPSVEIARAILSEGGTVKAYDPVAMEQAAHYAESVQMCADAYEVATGADALVLVTEWNEFKQLDLTRLHTRA